MTTARVRVLCPSYVGGVAQPVGAVLALPLLEALDAADSGRCEFVDADDRGRAMDARRAQIRGMLRRVPAMAEPGPWRPVY